MLAGLFESPNSKQWQLFSKSCLAERHPFLNSWQGKDLLLLLGCPAKICCAVTALVNFASSGITASIGHYLSRVVAHSLACISGAVCGGCGHVGCYCALSVTGPSETSVAYGKVATHAPRVSSCMHGAIYVSELVCNGRKWPGCTRVVVECR